MKNPSFRSWLPRSRGEDTGRSLQNSTSSQFPRLVLRDMREVPSPTWLGCGMQKLQKFSLVDNFIGWSAVGWLIIMFFA